MNTNTNTYIYIYTQTHTHTHTVHTNNKSSSIIHLDNELFSSSPKLSRDNWLIYVSYVKSHLSLWASSIFTKSISAFILRNKKLTLFTIKRTVENKMELIFALWLHKDLTVDTKWITLPILSVWIYFYWTHTSFHWIDMKVGIQAKYTGQQAKL